MGGGAVERTGLENRQGGNSFVGSNPTPSASVHSVRPGHMLSGLYRYASWPNANGVLRQAPRAFTMPATVENPENRDRTTGSIVFSRLHLLAAAFAEEFERNLELEAAKVDLARIQLRSGVLVARGLVGPAVVAFIRAARVAMRATAPAERPEMPHALSLARRGGATPPQAGC